MSNSAYYISLQKSSAKIDTFKSQRVLNFKPKQRKHYGLRRKEPRTSWLVVHVSRIRGTEDFWDGDNRQNEPEQERKEAAHNNY